MAHSIKDLGQGTNNVAEWAALIWAVMWAKDNGIKKCVIVGDSMLAISQATGRWKINNQLLSDLFKQYQQISQGIDLDLLHVGRSQNKAGIYLESGIV